MEKPKYSRVSTERAPRKFSHHGGTHSPDPETENTETLMPENTYTRIQKCVSEANTAEWMVMTHRTKGVSTEEKSRRAQSKSYSKAAYSAQ